MKTILFLGYYHKHNDPRLCHKEMRLLLAKEPALKIIFLDWNRDIESDDFRIVSEEVFVGKVRMTRIKCAGPYRSYPENFISRTIALKKQTKKLVNYAASLDIQVVQASDARELAMAAKISKRTNSHLIYDSHEDYYRQVVDYRPRSFKAKIKGLGIILAELFYIRKIDVLFCTDEFLLAKYKKWFYNAKNVYLLRNLPYGTYHNSSEFNRKNMLKLVYIGKVNEFRGVKECAEYCKSFNEESTDKKLEFTVYAQQTPILTSLEKQGLVKRYAWIDYESLMPTLQHYDVGVCLCYPITKFKRNLPLKNFDYMAAGLPILTSNFGNLKKYLDISKAGIGIDPMNYDEFKEAICRLFDPEVRKQFSDNGQNWIKETGGFVSEAQEYIRYMLSK